MKTHLQRVMPPKAAAHSEEERTLQIADQQPLSQSRPFKVTASSPASVHALGASGIQRTPDAATLDIAALCRSLYDAMDGPGTDEDAVYSALRRGAAYDVTRSRDLRIAYRHIYGADLMVDLQDDLSSGELAWALFYMGYLPASGGVLQSFQRERARANILNMNGSTLSAYTDILSSTQSGKEREYLHKALAAGHSISEIRTFADQIRGKDNAWLQNNLHLTASTTGRGLQQQWSHSCNISIVEAAQGEMDPIYALQVHVNNPNLYNEADPLNATAVNPNLAAEQRRLLTSNYTGSLGNMSGGVAVARGAANGQGRWADDLLNSHSGSTGVRYTTKRLGAGEITQADAIAAINRGVDRGIPVPIVVGDSTSAYAHYVLVTNRSGTNYTIHNPGDGITHTRTLLNITSNTINLSGWNVLSGIEVPAER